MASDDEGFQFIDPGILLDGELELSLSSPVPADGTNSTVPTCRFDIRMDGRVIGGMRFRAGRNEDVDRYAGNVGYNVDPEFRGNRYAERACRLLLPFAAAHGFETLWITCDPDNYASRKTCERLGAVLVEIVILPIESDMYRDGEREKCRYRLNVAAAPTRSN